MDRFISLFLLMYNVLDKVSGKPLKVSAIDASKHLHHTGREFTARDLEGVDTVSTKKVAPVVEEIVEVVEDVVEETVEEVVEEEETPEAPKKGRKAK